MTQMKNKKTKRMNMLRLTAIFAITLMIMLPISNSERGTINISTNPVLTTSSQQQTETQKQAINPTKPENEDEEQLQPAVLDPELHQTEDTKIASSNPYYEVRVNMSQSKIIDISTWNPIKNATITLSCESTCGGNSDTATAKTDEDGMTDELIATVDGCIDDEDADIDEETGRCGVEITHEDYRDFHIAKDDNDRNLQWEGPVIEWQSNLEESAAISSVSQMSNLASLAVSGTIGMDALSQISQMVGEGETIIGTVIRTFVGLIALLIFLPLLIYCTIAEDTWWLPSCDIDPDDIDVPPYPIENQLFALEHDREIEHDGETKIRSAFGENKNKLLGADPVIGKATNMTKQELNQWIIEQAEKIQNEGKEDISKIIHIEEDDENCLIDLEYPHNPNPKEEWINIEGERTIVQGERYGQDIMIQQGQTYQLTVLEKEDENDKLTFEVKITRITTEKEPSYPTPFTIDSLEHGVCIAEQQSEDEQGRIMNHQEQPSNTIAHNETYTPSPYYNHLVSEDEIVRHLGGEDKSVNMNLSCAPGDKVIDIDRPEEQPDSMLIRKELWDGVVDWEGADEDYDGDDCGKIDDEDVSCAEDLECYDEEKNLCVEIDEDGKIEQVCKATSETNILHYMIPCQEGTREGQIHDMDREEKLEIQRAPRQFDCAEMAEDEDERGIVCPMGAPYFEEIGKCAMNTLTE